MTERPDLHGLPGLPGLPGLDELVAESLTEARARAKAALVEELTAAYLAAARRRLATEPDAAPPPPAQLGPARYVYGFTLGQPDLTGLTGVSGAPVAVVERGGVSALASPADADRIARLPHGDLREHGPLATEARRHDDIVRAVFAQVPLLPLRFGTVYRDEAGVAAFLDAHAAALRAELERLSDAGEWNVRLYRLDQPAGDGAPPYPAEPDAGGTAYLAGRAARAQLRERLRAADDAAAATVVEELAPLALEWASGTARDRGDGSRPVLAAAFLVPRAEADRFAAAAARAQAALAGEGLDLDVAGPWPPYQFSRVKELADA